MTNQDIYHHRVPGGAVAYAWSRGAHAYPLVMVHGLGDSAIMTFPDRVANGPLATTPILFIDLPGFGSSRFGADHPATVDRYADDIASLLTSLGVQSTAVFGHSMGGNIVIHLARQYPHLVSRLIVAEALLQRTQSVLASDIARFDEETFASRRFPMLVRATSLQAHRGDVAAANFLEPLRLANPIAMHRAAISLVSHAQLSLDALQTGTAIPRTFIVGSRTLVDTSALEKADIQIVRIPNAGHFMLAEQKTATTYAILEAIT